MSRLQVGGLALLINDVVESNVGKVVRLEKYEGETVGLFSGKNLSDTWFVSCEDGFVMPNGMLYKGAALTESKNLLPLGDKQTQDELAKEKELEHDH